MIDRTIHLRQTLTLINNGVRMPILPDHHLFIQIVLPDLLTHPGLPKHPLRNRTSLLARVLISNRRGIPMDLHMSECNIHRRNSLLLECKWQTDPRIGDQFARKTSCHQITNKQLNLYPDNRINSTSYDHLAYSISFYTLTLCTFTHSVSNSLLFYLAKI